MDSIGQRIKHRRKELKLSQTELAQKTGIAQSSLSALETNPGAKTSEVAKIAAVLGVNAIWLSDGKGEMISDGTSQLIHHEIPADVLRLAERLVLLPEDKIKAISVLLGIKLN